MAAASQQLPGFPGNAKESFSVFDVIDLLVNQMTLLEPFFIFGRRLACGHVAVKREVFFCVSVEIFPLILVDSVGMHTEGPFLFILYKRPLFFFSGSKGTEGETIMEVAEEASKLATGKLCIPSFSRNTLTCK